MPPCGLRTLGHHPAGVDGRIKTNMMKIMEGFTGQRSVVVPQAILDISSEDALLRALHITAMGYYPKAENHFRAREVPIEDFVLIYCVDGKGWYETDGYRQLVPSNSFFILPAGAPHRYGADSSKPWTIYWIHFRGLLAPEYAKLPEKVVKITPSSHSRIRERNDLFEEIFGSLDRGLTPDSIRYASALFHHYLATLRYLSEYRGVTGKGDQEDIVDATIHYLEENVEKGLSLQQIADYSGLSASRLSAVFKKRTGYSPLAFFNNLKMRQACRLLTDTDMKVNTICHKVGIGDPYYFSRLFSKVIGLSPREYRRRSEI